MNDVERRWGSYTVLVSKPDFTVKLLTFAPNQFTSVQRHKLRGERWTVVEGSLCVTLPPSIAFTLNKGQSYEIPPMAVHQLGGAEEGAKVVEIMFGQYDEDDIERFGV